MGHSMSQLTLIQILFVQDLRSLPEQIATASGTLYEATDKANVALSTPTKKESQSLPGYGNTWAAPVMVTVS